MIRLFGQTDRLFSSNGDVVLKPTRAIVHKEDNGSFYLDLECPLEYVSELTEGRIIIANTPQGDQAFRITNPQKTKHKISTQARHVFYDSLNYLIQDSYVVDADCNYALDHLNSATEPASPFTTISDITSVSSYRCVRKSLYEAVMECLERYGGHLVRDNFSIGIRDSIGTDNGVTVRYRKNLKEITCNEVWDNVVTKILPTGRDGIMLNAVDETESVYITSDAQYDLPYTKTVSFEQQISDEAYRDENGTLDEDAYKSALVDDLRNQAIGYLNNNSIPQLTYTLSANLEKLTDIGDTIQVIDERLGINVMTNVITFDYDCILGRYIQVEFGNFQQTITGLVSTINANTERLVDESLDPFMVTLGQELKEATDRIWNALGNSYVIYDGDKILVVDSLPKETAHYVLMINSGGIGFSSNGINGTFNSCWDITGTMNMQNFNVVNLTANMIKGGTLKLGSLQNQSGILEIYDEQNNLIGRMDKDGLKMYGLNGSYVLMNNDVGFSGYDRNGTRIYWVDKDEFHMRKSVVEEEITLCGRMRFIAITITENNQVVNDGIGLVAVVEGIS